MLKIQTLNKDVIEAMTGYRPFTTFFEDFSIAEKFGTKEIKDTYKNIMKEWKSDYKYFTEFVMTLNWKIWAYYQVNDEFAKLYNDLWKQADTYAMDHFKDEELEYFIRTTD